jgi:thiol-disulfide isomerase/thioredoxin
MDRRTMLAGLAALAGTRAVGAAPSPQSLFHGTALAGNFIAWMFQRMDLALPAIPLMSEHGAMSLPQLRGRTTILTLWAEWCAPCLLEARDLAVLRRKYASSRFDIVPLLTSSKKPLDYRGARAKLATMGAGDLPLLIEPHGGAQMLHALSAVPGAAAPAGLPGSFRPNGALPCTLLVDSSGRVRGRSLGAPIVAAAMPAPKAGAGPQTLTEAEKKRMLGGDVHTAWTTPQGDAFVRALASGLLEQTR